MALFKSVLTVFKGILSYGASILWYITEEYFDNVYDPNLTSGTFQTFQDNLAELNLTSGYVWAYDRNKMFLPAKHAKPRALDIFVRPFEKSSESWAPLMSLARSGHCCHVL